MVVPQLSTLLTSIPYWFGLPVLVTLVGYLPFDYVEQSTLLMLYLIMVLVCAFKTDYVGLMASALLSFLFFNYFHTEPRYSLLMNNLNELVPGVLFFVFALLAGNVSFQLKRQLHNLETQDQFLRAQVTLGQKLQNLEREEDMLPLLDAVSREVFGGGVDFRLLPPRTAQNPEDAWRLTWILRDKATMSQESHAMLLSVKEQAQAVLEKLSVSRALKQAERASDEERLRSALLSSVSHDLKTPLVTMMGAATSLRDLGKDISEADARDLLDSIIGESRRLESYIQNLLDMTRLGQEKLPLAREWISFDEIYHVVLRRLARQWPRHGIRLKSEADLPQLNVHPALIEQGLFNALDNALKAGGPDQEVLVDVRKCGDSLTVRVYDHGPGLPPSEWEAVFDQFHTFSQGDYKKGTGLGLSICRSIFRVHGGDAVIVPPARDFGHCLQLTLPIGETAEESAAAVED